MASKIDKNEALENSAPKLPPSTDSAAEKTPSTASEEPERSTATLEDAFAPPGQPETPPDFSRNSISNPAPPSEPEAKQPSPDRTHSHTLFSRSVTRITELLSAKKWTLPINEAITELQKELSLPISYSAQHDQGSLTSKRLSPPITHFSNADGEREIITKLPKGQGLRLPEGAKILKQCGGGSGSINLLISLDNQRHFMKVFFASRETSRTGHSAQKQFSEGWSGLRTKDGAPRFEDPKANLDVQAFKAFVTQHRPNVEELGVLSGTDATTLAQQAPASSQSRVEEMAKALAENPTVESTYILQEAIGGQELADAIAAADPTELQRIVRQTVNYLGDMAVYATRIASREVSLAEGHEVIKERWFTTKQRRFDAINTSSTLSSMDFSEPLQFFNISHSKGLNTFSEMMRSEFYPMAGKRYPNPHQFLEHVFSTFPDIFSARELVFEIHGDGQASNLMLQPDGTFVQVDTRPGLNLVDPHLEAAKMVVFGPPFAKVILSGLARVSEDKSGLVYGAHPEAHLPNHETFKREVLKLLESTPGSASEEADVQESLRRWQSYTSKVSPHFNVTIRLLGALQAESDTGSILGTLEGDPLNQVLKRRVIANKVLALKLQAEFIEFVLTDKSVPAALRDHITTTMNTLNKS